jgi:hypothetical protein
MTGGFGLECRHLTEHSSRPPPPPPSKTETISSVLNIYPIHCGGPKTENLLHHPNDRGDGHCCITAVNTLLPLAGNGLYITVHAWACPNVFSGLFSLCWKIKVGLWNKPALCLCLYAPRSLLCNGLVNIFPQQQTHMQQHNNCWPSCFLGGACNIKGKLVISFSRNSLFCLSRVEAE